jgi:hypothetical protein
LEGRGAIMKKIKKILIGCAYVLAVVLLAAYGFGMFDRQETTDVAQETQEEEETNDVAQETQENGETDGEEMLYQEEFGIEYPAAPKEAGMEILYDEDFTIPSDESIKNLFVYQFHDLFNENETKKKEKYADTLSQKLLEDFFPGEKWNRVVESNDSQDNYVYRIQGKEENGFQYTANKDGIDNTQLLCEPGEITVPVPEDGDYDKAYQDFSMEMLKYFQVGLWDGENVHMALTDTKDVTETGGYYRYMVELDGIRMTKCYFSSNFNSWAAFHYEDGSLLGMFQMAQTVLDGKREFKPMYSGIEEAVEKLKQGIEIEYKRYAGFGDGYYIAKVKDVSLEYMEYYGKDGASYVPILTAYIQQGLYNINEGTWNWREKGYNIQLETGEVDEGDYVDNYLWETNMTDR